MQKLQLHIPKEEVHISKHEFRAHQEEVHPKTRGLPGDEGVHNETHERHQTTK